MAEIYRGWGEQDFERGNFERARQNYNKILTIFPEDREAIDRLAAVDTAERAEAERRRLARIERERPEEQETLDTRLRRERGFSRVEGVWTTERTGEWQTDQGVSYPTQRTLTLTLQVEGQTVQGALVAGEVDTLPLDNYWVDQVTSERCGVGPDGRVRTAESRQPLEGTVHEDGSVTFTTVSGAILSDECGLLRSGGVDSIQPTGTYSGELSPDDLSLTLNWTWVEFLGGDSIILSAVESERRVSLRPERTVSRVEGVWTTVRTGQDKTDGGTPFPSERTLTLVLQADGSTLRGSMTTHSVGTLPSENHWVDEITSERCGGAPDGRVRHAEGRQPLEGTVHEDGSVTFTTSSGESVVDDCSLLRKHGPDRLLDTGTFNGELSSDGGSITLDWEWSDFLGGGNMILSRVGEGFQRLGSVDPEVRGAINILIVYENRFEAKLQELLSELRSLGYDPSLGNVSEGFSCTANARALALGGKTDGAVLDELRSVANGVMPNFFTEWVDETESNHIYLCESEG